MIVITFVLMIRMEMESVMNLRFWAVLIQTHFRDIIQMLQTMMGLVSQLYLDVLTIQCSIIIHSQIPMTAHVCHLYMVVWTQMPVITTF